jgi:Sarcosine oxidase delta subunit
MDAPAEAWVDAIYMRADPRGPHREVWRHAQGCGAWVVVTRNTATHEVLGAEFQHPGLRAAAASGEGGA